MSLIKMKSLLAVGSIALAVAAGGVAWAGAKANYTVNVDVASRFAYGSLGAARNSADNTQYIGCYMVAAAQSSSVSGYCYANNSAGQFLTCTFDSSSPGLMSVVSSLSGDSYLYFGSRADGMCGFIYAINSSDYAPKLP